MFVRKNRWAVVAATLGLALFGAASDASAAKLKTLYSFCPEGNCSNGTGPTGGLVRDGHGNLFGMTGGGGANNRGAVFELARKTQGIWEYKTLYSFCSQRHCADGANPWAGLVLDTTGNLYGATNVGGRAHGLAGVIFELTRAGEYKLLHAFCSQKGCADGKNPQIALTYAGASEGALYDGTSPLYGATKTGGSHKKGTVFKLEPQEDGTWTHTVLRSFSNPGPTYPSGRIALDAEGNIYGATLFGGEHNYGAIYEITAAAKQKVLYSFCPLPPACTDGRYANGGVTMDAAHNLYGVTGLGGTQDQGVVYRFVPDSASYSVLHDFCSQEQCADGTNSGSGLTIDANGNVLGVAEGGGAFNNGVVFQIDPAGNQKVLYSFCFEAGCTDGAAPSGELGFDASGNLIGTTSGGGANGEGGTIFKLSH